MQPCTMHKVSSCLKIMPSTYSKEDNGHLSISFFSLLVLYLKCLRGGWKCMRNPAKQFISRKICIVGSERIAFLHYISLLGGFSKKFLIKWKDFLVTWWVMMIQTGCSVCIFNSELYMTCSN